MHCTRVTVVFPPSTEESNVVYIRNDLPLRGNKQTNKKAALDSN